MTEARDRKLSLMTTFACKGRQHPFDEIYCQCDRASQELAALAIMLTGDAEMFGYKLPSPNTR
jgi:hypothetical protein